MLILIIMLFYWNLLSVCIFTIAPYFQAFAQPHPYNEYMDRNGNIRPAFRAFEKRFGVDPLSPNPQQTQALATTHPLGDKIRIFPIPLVLSSRELNTVLRPGVEQRSRALIAFFEDVVLGKGHIYHDQAGLLFPHPLTPTLVKRIFMDEGWNLEGLRALWKGKTKKDISFISGSDIVRKPNGKFVVLEDNTGNVGGLGDISAIRQKFFEVLGIDHIEDNYFEAMIKWYFTQNGIDPKDPAVIALLHVPSEINKPKERADLLNHDLEDKRKQAILNKFGIKTIDPEETDETERQELYSGKYKHVLNFDDDTNWKRQYEFYLRLFGAPGVKFLNAPGTNALSNKAFLPFVDGFIRFYLGEEPLFKTQPTKIYTPYKPDDFADGSPKVMKLALGRQGKDIFIIPRMHPLEVQHAHQYFKGLYQYKVMSGQPVFLWVEQEYVDPSQLPPSKGLSWIHYYVDYRLIALATWQHGIYTMQTPWGRTIDDLGDGKNNVSRGAFELVITSEACKSVLRGQR